MCEFCPADGGACAVCAAPDEAATPTLALIHDVGFRGALAGDTLARTLWLAARRFGPLDEAQLAAVIDGHKRGALE